MRLTTALATAVAWCGTGACDQTVTPAAPPRTALEHSHLERFHFEELHFGKMPVQITLYAADAATARRAADAAFAHIARLDRMFSDYALDPPSPLNRIAAQAPEPVEVPAELFEALRLGIDAHRLTDGAFDITAKPFVQLWRVSRRLGELPPKSRLRRAAEFVDIEGLQLDPAARTARLARAGMWLDLGGLAKGMIGDDVVRLLRARGVPRCRYHAGGDMVFGDPPPGEDGWLVEVPDLLVVGADGTPRPLRFRIEDGAASVSGDVHRYVEIDDVRYAHVIDPRTGLGVTERRVACVRGERGALTDPLATAGLVMAETAWRRALQESGCRGHLWQPGAATPR